MTVPTPTPATGDLNDLVSQSLRFGSDLRWVQGAGGNISVKAGDTIWIKASGTRLKEAADRQIFVALDLPGVAPAVLDTEDLAPFVAGPATGLRPSIETAIHTLLPHRFVTHVHSIGAIALAIRDDAASAVALLGDLARVTYTPYARPGIPLARAILRTLQSEPIDPEEPLIALLGNHGIIVGASTAQQVTDLLSAVEERLAPAGSLAFDAPAGDADWLPFYPAGTLDPRQADVLLGGPLTPDQAVFLSGTPFARAGEDAGDDTLLRITADGGVEIRRSASTDAVEIAASFIDIARLFPEDAVPAYLTGANVDELVNWDAEKWRKEQES